MPSTQVERPLQIHLFMQNKAKVKYAKINLSSFLTSKYKLFGHLVIEKTNPIQSQTNPILGQYQGYQTQNKANSNPIKVKTNPILSYHVIINFILE